MRKYIFVFCIAVSCGQNKSQYETNDWFEANLTLSAKKLYHSESLQIIVNGKTIYWVNGDTVKYALYKFFKIPQTFKEITVVGRNEGKVAFKNSINTFSNAKRFQILISAPYPKEFDSQPYPYQSKWFILPIDSIKRDIIIRPDTSQNNIIL